MSEDKKNKTIVDKLKLLEKLTYSFPQYPEKNKRFNLIRQIIFRYLFRYSHRQILFNQNLHSLLSDIVIAQTDLQQSIQTIKQKQVEISNNSNKKFFSQFGEDKWLVENVKLPKKGVFVDVGTADGKNLSNTYYFEKFLGWRGVCFEPDPRNWGKAILERENVKLLAIGNKSGYQNFYLSKKTPDWSSLKENKENKYDIIKVKVESLNKALKAEGISEIDLLSIDTEGTELEILSKFDFKKYRPKIIIIEYNTQDIIDKSALKFFAKLPYKLIHTTEANFIFELTK